MFKIPLFDLSSVFYTSCTKKEPYLFIGKTHKFKNCLNLMTLGNRFLSFPDISTITDDDYNQIMKISIHFDSLSQREEILRQIPKHLTFTNFMHLGGEITHSEYNKATAIQFVKNYYKEKYETVAMGDSENDLPMLEYADISIAMGNGVKEVKEKADYVTDKIDNDGLYKAFKHLKLF